VNRRDPGNANDPGDRRGRPDRGRPGGRDRRYHHGDLRAALIDTAIELIAEHGGMRGFSMAEASRRLGVAVSAPYAHFADREDLLAAVTVRGFEQFRDALLPEMDRFTDPADRLVAMTSAYVRFAAASPAIFEMLYESGVDKTRHPEVHDAERPLDQAFLDCVRALADDDEGLATDLATAVEATARGHVMLLLDSGPGQEGQPDVTSAVARTARAVHALIEGRRLLALPYHPEEEPR
jgi:AcrR family transcriptional regulator